MTNNIDVISNYDARPGNLWLAADPRPVTETPLGRAGEEGHERTERLILILVGTGFTGLGIPYALQVCLGLLLVGSTITVGQRFAAVHQQSKGRALSDSGS